MKPINSIDPYLGHAEDFASTWRGLQDLCRQIAEEHRGDEMIEAFALALGRLTGEMMPAEVKRAWLRFLEEHGNIGQRGN